MLALNNLSRVGFGCYRIGDSDAEHRKALEHAIKEGCNVLDTAANYMRGESERLIGQLALHYDERKLFIVSKAGYADPADLKILKDDKIHRLKDGLLFSIHPDFLNLKLQASLARLNRKYLDGFLLHNPEYLLKNVKVPEFTQAMVAAAAFMEDKANQGLIRYWGISSNIMRSEHVNEIEMALQLIEAKGAPHLKLIQFPFNLIESETITDREYSTDRLKKKGYYLFSNRPFNANEQSGPSRLAYTVKTGDLDEKIERSLEQLGRFVQEVTEEENVFETFEPLTLLRDNWNGFSHPDVVNKFFQSSLLPFFEALFANGGAAELRSESENLQALLAKKSLENSSDRFVAAMMERGIYTPGEAADRYTQKTIEYYHTTGRIDTVLIGMRNRNYVNAAKMFFQRNA